MYAKERVSPAHAPFFPFKITVLLLPGKNISASASSGPVGNTTKAEVVRSRPAATGFNRIPDSNTRIHSFFTADHWYPAEALQPCSSASPPVIGTGGAGTGGGVGLLHAAHNSAEKAVKVMIFNAIFMK